MELPGLYFDEERGKYFPITQQYLNSKKESKQKNDRNKKLREVEQSRNKSYNKNKMLYADLLNRAFHFDEINKTVDSNLYHCINNSKLLKATPKCINPSVKSIIILPAPIRDIELDAKITILKHNNHQLEYLTLDYNRKCYHHKEAIENGKFKRGDVFGRGLEICRDLNEDIKNIPLGYNNESLKRVDNSIFFSYGYEPKDSETHQPTVHRFMRSTGLFLDERAYKFDIKIPEEDQFRSFDMSLNYVAVASKDELFIHHWMANEKAMFTFNFNNSSHKRRKGKGKRPPSSDIISIIFAKRGKEKLHKLNGHLCVGFRNGTLLAIPINENAIEFDKRFNVPLPSSVISIVSLHECSKGGILVSAVSKNPDDNQLLLYIPKLSQTRLKKLKIIRLNTKYSVLTSEKEICVLTKNKKFLCYGKKGENHEERNNGGFDIFLLDSLECKAKNNTSEYLEIYPVKTMYDFVKKDLKGTGCKLRSLNAIENIQTPFSRDNSKANEVALEYEVERAEPGISDGSRISMIFHVDLSRRTDLRDENYMIISVNLA